MEQSASGYDSSLDFVHHLRDLFGVGKHKPMGYEVIAAIEAMGGNQSIVTGLLTATGREVMVYGNALYTFHRQSLQRLLKRRWLVLAWHRWPHDVDEFVEHVATGDWAPQGTYLWNLVADAFGDHNNSGCRGRGGF